MRRFLVLATLFFYLFASVQTARATVAPVIVGAASIGILALTMGTSQYYFQNGKMPAYVTATANAVASAADYMFNPAYLAIGPLTLTTPISFPGIMQGYLTKEASLGINIGTLTDMLREAADGAYSRLKDIFASNTPPPTYPTSDSPFASGFPLRTHDGLKWYRLLSGNMAADWYPLGSFVSVNAALKYLTGGVKPNYPVQYRGYTVGNVLNSTTIMLESTSSGVNLYVWGGALGWETGEYPYPPPPVPVPNYDAVKNALNQALQDSPEEVAEDVRKAIKEAPPGAVVASAGAVPSSVADKSPPPGMTAQEIEQALLANSAAVKQLAAQQAAAIAAANPDNAAAQIAAIQAAADAAEATNEAAQSEAEKPEEETYPAISSSGFADAYNPGEFDIPARFTSFLNNIKSSSLFSFSSSFFNSLPGGGSPVYEIEAGQYGHHRIDLSQTLSAGLVVLKTVLLLCFGFLSIRAVIMKR